MGAGWVERAKKNTWILACSLGQPLSFTCCFFLSRHSWWFCYWAAREGNAQSRNTFHLCRKKTKWRTELPQGFACYINYFPFNGDDFCGDSTGHFRHPSHWTISVGRQKSQGREGGKNWPQTYKPFGAKGCTKETLNGTESLAISTPDLV